MTKKEKPNKRERLINAAAELFYHKGPLTTSLADIAASAAIPIGNVYYYFKTKEELILAVIDRRRISMNQAYEQLNKNIHDPRERLIGALRFFESVKKEYSQYGCPLGRLVVELGEDSVEAKKATAQVLEEFVDWATDQFKALGHEDVARQYAVMLVSGIQGAAVMAKAYADEALFASEMNRLMRWIEEIPNTHIPVGKFGFNKQVA